MGTIHNKNVLKYYFYWFSSWCNMPRKVRVIEATIHIKWRKTYMYI